MGSKLVTSAAMKEKNFDLITSKTAQTIGWIRKARGVPLFLGFEHSGLYPLKTKAAAIADWYEPALPGTAIFFAAFMVSPFLGLSFRRTLSNLWRCLVQLIPSLLAISFMVGLAYVTRYSGMDTIIGISLTRTGWIFPLFGTLLGWIGVALTGTDAGSNALFGNLQKVTAEQLHISPVLMGSANSARGVMHLPPKPCGRGRRNQPGGQRGGNV